MRPYVLSFDLCPVSLGGLGLLAVRQHDVTSQRSAADIVFDMDRITERHEYVCSSDLAEIIGHQRIVAHFYTPHPSLVKEGICLHFFKWQCYGIMSIAAYGDDGAIHPFTEQALIGLLPSWIERMQPFWCHKWHHVCEQPYKTDVDESSISTELADLDSLIEKLRQR